MLQPVPKAGVHALVSLGSAAQMRDQPAVATRYDQLAVRYEATAQIAAINDWLGRVLT